MIPSWIPVSPCTDNCKDRDGYCPPNGRFGCTEYKEYQAEIEGQIKLLQHQIHNPPKGAIYPYQFEIRMRELLEQLEALMK